MNRPGGNVTGIAALTIELDPKRLELLHEMAPPGPIGALVNPSRPELQSQIDGINAAAKVVNRELLMVYARSGEQIDAAFATFARRPVVGLLVGADAYFTSQRT